MGSPSPGLPQACCTTRLPHPPPCCLRSPASVPGAPMALQGVVLGPPASALSSVPSAAWGCYFLILGKCLLIPYEIVADPGDAWASGLPWGAGPGYWGIHPPAGPGRSSLRLRPGELHVATHGWCFLKGLGGAWGHQAQWSIPRAEPEPGFGHPLTVYLSKGSSLSSGLGFPICAMGVGAGKRPRGVAGVVCEGPESVQPASAASTRREGPVRCPGPFSSASVWWHWGERWTRRMPMAGLASCCCSRRVSQLHGLPLLAEEDLSSRAPLFPWVPLCVTDVRCPDGRARPLPCPALGPAGPRWAEPSSPHGAQAWPGWGALAPVLSCHGR